MLLGCLCPRQEGKRRLLEVLSLACQLQGHASAITGPVSTPPDPMDPMPAGYPSAGNESEASASSTSSSERTLESALSGAPCKRSLTVRDGNVSGSDAHHYRQ